MATPTEVQSSTQTSPWSNQHTTAPAGYTVSLTPNHVEEVEAALASFKSQSYQHLPPNASQLSNQAIGLCLGAEDVNRTTFPLPTLGPVLEREAEAIHTERGFVVVQGLDASQHTAEENTIIYLGVANYMADKRGIQDKKGNVLCKCALILHSSHPC